MTRIRHIRRLAGVLAGLAGAVLAFAVAAPAALASQLRPDPPWWLKHWPLPVHLPPGSPGLVKHPPLPAGHASGPAPVYHVPAHTAVTGGTPGWQIAVIAAGAALAVATVLVLLDRAGRAPEDPLRRPPDRGTCPGHPDNLPAGRPGAARGPAGGAGRAASTHPGEPLIDSGLLFPGRPADPDRGGGRCGLPAEVWCRFMVLAGACTRVTVTGRAMPA